MHIFYGKYTYICNYERHWNTKAEGNHRLAIEQEGEIMLIVIGLNPSTADERPTMKSVLRFVEHEGYDGYVMVNLYSERCTNYASEMV